jgi:hypothetical protein
VVNFRIVGLDKSKGVASNFMQVGQGGNAASLHFVRSFPIKGGGSSEVGEVSQGGAEFIPEGQRGIA